MYVKSVLVLSCTYPPCRSTYTDTFCGNLQDDVMKYLHDSLLFFVDTLEVYMHLFINLDCFFAILKRYIISLLFNKDGQPLTNTKSRNN